MNATIIDIRTICNLSENEKVLLITDQELDVRIDEDGVELELPTPTIGWNRTPSSRDDLARLIEIQMGMSLIQARRNVVIEKLEDAKSGNYIPKPQFMALIGEAKKLKAMWARGIAASKEAVNGDKGLWSWYFNLEEEDRAQLLEDYISEGINLYQTWAGNDELEYDEYGMPVIDSRHAPTDEIYADSHVEEMAAYDVKVVLPVQTGGYVAPCRDVTHEYVQPKIDEEDFDSLIQTLNF